SSPQPMPSAPPPSASTSAAINPSARRSIANIPYTPLDMPSGSEGTIVPRMVRARLGHRQERLRFSNSGPKFHRRRPTWSIRATMQPTAVARTDGRETMHRTEAFSAISVVSRGRSARCFATTPCSPASRRARKGRGWRSTPRQASPPFPSPSRRSSCSLWPWRWVCPAGSASAGPSSPWACWTWRSPACSRPSRRSGSARNPRVPSRSPARSWPATARWPGGSSSACAPPRRGPRSRRTTGRRAAFPAAASTPPTTADRGVALAPPRGRPPRSVELFVVHGVEKVLVLLGGELALDLQRGRDLALLQGEIARRDGELLDGLEAREIGVDLVHGPLDGLADGGVPRHLLVARNLDAPLLEELAPVGSLHRDECGQVLALVPVDDHLADERVGLEQALDLLGRDVLSARGDDDVLLAVGDPQVAVLVDLADVAGGEPAVGAEHGGGLIGAVVVALHHAAAAHEHL